MAQFIYITTFGRSLVDDADAAAARTTLGLGTAATQNTGAFDAAGAAAAAQAASQPLDSDLTAIAALSTTAYGRALLALANQAALQSTVGVSGTNTGDQTSIVGITGTKAQFDTACSDGDFIYSGGALGTPASGTLTNCTGLPVGTGVSGLGTGVATLLGGASSGTGGPAGTAAPTFTGTVSAANITSTANGAASTPAVSVTGTPFAGTGTTSFPLVYVNQSTATASTTLNTAGTFFGANAHGSQDLFVGMKDGVNQFLVSSAGRVSANSFARLTIKSYTDGATITFDLSYDLHVVPSLGGNRTLVLSNGVVGQTFLVKLTQDGTGSRTVTWWNTITWPGGVVPTLTTTAGKSDTFSFLCTGANTYDGYVVAQNQ